MGLLSKAKKREEELKKKHPSIYTSKSIKKTSSLQKIREKLVEHNKKVREKFQKKFQERKILANAQKTLKTSLKQEPKQESVQKVYHSNNPHETYLDDIYAQLQETGELNLSTLASKYGIEMYELESFVKILDKEKLIELYYPAIGSPILRKLGYEEEKHSQNKQKADTANPKNLAAKKQKIINLTLFAILVFAVIILAYLIYLNKALAKM